MKAVDYINELIKERDEFKELCKKHVERINVMKREITKLNNTNLKMDKKIQKLENESINIKTKNELDKVKNDFKHLKEDYKDLQSKYNDILNENVELKKYNEFLMENQKNLITLCKQVANLISITDEDEAKNYKTIRVGGAYCDIMFKDDPKYVPLAKFLEIINAIPVRE